MLNTVLEDAQWLESLPPALDFDLEKFIWSQPDVDIPVRIEPRETLWSGLPLEPAEGEIYAVHYTSGNTREVLVWGSPPDLNVCSFLKPGRTGKTMDSVAPFIIDDATEVVPDDVKGLIREHLESEAQAARAHIRASNRVASTHSRASVRTHRR